MRLQGAARFSAKMVCPFFFGTCAVAGDVRAIVATMVSTASDKDLNRMPPLLRRADILDWDSPRKIEAIGKLASHLVSSL